MVEVQFFNGNPDSAALGSVKVLRISHSGSVAAYRERERQLLRQNPKLNIRLMVPEKWNHLGGSIITDESFEIVKLKTYGTGSIPLFVFDPIVLSKVIRHFQPDIVDIHEEPYSVSCFEIVSLIQLLRPTASCVFYSAQNILKKYPIPFSLSEQYVYRKCVGAYPCSSEVRDVLKAKGFNTNCRVIPLGTDTSVFRPIVSDRAKFGLRKNAFVVGYFGRLEQCKGLEYLFEAVHELSDQIDWQLFVIGKGTYEAPLRALSTNLSISERIIWTAAWKEQFGRAVVESMACGVPVIASDSGSLPEVVRNAGVLVPEKSSLALAQQLRRMCQNPAERSDFSIKGQALVQSEYTWKKVAESTIELYAEALRIHTQRRADAICSSRQ